MKGPVPSLKPNIELGAEAVQLNVVFTTPELRVMPVVMPEQIVWDEGVARATGVGST